MVSSGKSPMAAAVGTTSVVWTAAAAAASAAASAVVVVVVVGEQEVVLRPPHQLMASSLVDGSALRCQAAASRLASPRPPMSQVGVEVVHATSSLPSVQASGGE